ncbi:uncharacterized protein LOC124422199 [Vespa crabro]|uniref:uncharacterized protein LOC124422199 n=1 Tax=Vespa crabro TaxID=7445 RepID=UPI001F007B7F|nr:uncharacterized protein LOC124422199 [Vespa crabro]
MSSKTERLFFESLQHKALECLDTFPSKVVELNEIIEEYMPESAKNNVNVNTNVIYPRTRSVSTLSSIRDCKPIIIDFDVATYYSLSMCDRNRTKRRIYKRKYHRIYGGNNATIRRYPGALGQLLAFIISRLASYTKKIVFTPSYFVIDNIIPMFFQKSELQNAQCGTSSNWSSSVLEYTSSIKHVDTIVDTFIGIMRPAAVQLIADITILKRWLQALVLIKNSLESIELTNATRTTETIDCWAYELYFHLKNLQVSMRDNQMREEKKVIYTTDSMDRNSMTHLNLWHRMVQLRNNYIILYETLNNNQNILNLASMEVS